jgi:two-component system, response regulator YesN
MMLGVLLVDDEIIVRYGIKSMVDWDKLGLTIVGDAENGQDALEIFKACNPEIVITDIKMPIMDGIEFIKSIRGMNSETKIIILSCLQDFEYAKEAISLGASEYFVKSNMMPSDMERILVKVKNSIIVEKDKQKQIFEMREKALKTQFVEKKQFLLDLSMDAVSNYTASKRIIRQMHLDYLTDEFFVFNASVDYYEKVTLGMTEQEKANLDGKLCDVIEKVLKSEGSCKGEVFFGNNGEISFLLKVLDSLSELKIFEFVNSIVEKLIRAVENETNYSITVGVSDPISDLSSLSNGYTQAKSARKFKVFYGCGKLINYKNVISENHFDKKVSINFTKLREYIYLIKREDVNILLEETFNRITEIRDYEGVHTLSLELIVIVSSIYSEICKDVELVYNKKKEYYQQIKYLETIKDIKNWFKFVFGQLMDSVAIMYNSDKNTISKALEYIDKNFTEDISLQTISNHVHLSKNYFVNLFKKEMGQSFVEYLTKLRIEKAKILLQNSELKIIDIGMMVGIEDSRYFSKVFKKSTGFTPKEYREKSIKQR